MIRLTGEGGRCPLALLITPRQRGDTSQLIPLMERIRVGRAGGGHPRTRPGHLGGVRRTRPPKKPPLPAKTSDQACHPRAEEPGGNRQARGSKGGRPASFDKATYKRRNEVKRRINALKNFWAVTMRFNNRAHTSTTTPSLWPRSGCGSARDLLRYCSRACIESPACLARRRSWLSVVLERRPPTSSRETHK